MKKIFLILCMAILVFAACEDKNTELITVASERANCVGVAPQKCLLIKHKESVGWEFLYSGIQEFDYESGYEYVLKVRKESVSNPAADQSSSYYVLVEVVSKSEKVSEDMPLGVIDDSLDEDLYQN